MNAMLIIFIVIQASMCVEDGRIITTLKYSKYRVKPVVVNGEPVLNSKVPYLVSIKETKNVHDKIVWSNLCGGSILGANKVVTAAHCFEGNNFYYAKNPEQLRVFAGTIYTDIVNGTTHAIRVTEESQWRDIARIVMHSDFVFPMNDIALVFVKNDWMYSEVVGYIKPARRTQDYPYRCASAGYGGFDHSKAAEVSKVLLMARIRVIPRWQCSVIWQMDMSSFVCSNSEFGDVARGDSGGPLVCQDPRALDEDTPGREMLVGVVSGKNFDKTTLYTRVSAYHDWIERNFSYKIAFMLNINMQLLIYFLFLLN